MNNSSASRDVVLYAVSIPLTGVSTIACVISLGVLLYYKMWQRFIYRLVLYMFISLTCLSLSIISSLSHDLVVATGGESEKVNLTTSNKTGIANGIIIIFVDSSLATTFMLVTSIAICIYLMALHNYQFTYKSDMCLLVPSILYPLIVVVPTIVRIVTTYGEYYRRICIFVGFSMPLFTNIVFTALTLVPLCCRACGYNLCMKTAATIESHRKALKEVLPLFILVVPSSVLITLLLSLLRFQQNADFQNFIYNDVFMCFPGLLSALSFALHLFFIRNNLSKLRGKKKAKDNMNDYGTINHHRTHRTTAYTTEGISETCNTEYVVVSESEEDTRLLQQKNNRRL